MIEVELPDGTIAEFPAGTSNEVIKRALQRRFAPRVDPATNQPPGIPEYAPPGVEGYDAQTGEVTPAPRSMAASAMHGAADVAGFGFTDELASYLGSGLTGRPREEVLAEMRGMQQQAQEDNPWSYMGGQFGGGLVQGLGIAGGGLSMAANAARAGGGLGRIAMGSAADGLVAGALHGAGSGEDAASRAIGAAKGAAGGTLVGGAAPYAIAGAQQVLSPFVRPIMSRLRPETYASRAMGEGLRRSGMSTDDIADALTRARADSQDMFNVADAMGHSGQRMLSTVARNPNEMRQQVVETLTGRQMGQGDRLSQFLAEGFDASDTAAQRQAALTASRSATADANYAAARQGAGPVNLNSAIEEIDKLLRRDPILGDTALSTGPLGNRLTALRDQLQRGGEQLVDFDNVLNIKSDLFQQMQRNPQVANDMRGVYGLLDEALEGASSGYRAANDTFRQQSRTIDAVDIGTKSASGRVRSSDSVQRFNAMTPEEQAAFRAGYVDPMIARVESSSISPTTNKARPLMSPKTGEEFPAFAAPGRADQLGDRIAREQRMFETANTALGGSKTADNLADAAEMAQFDPGIMANLFHSPVRAALDIAGKLAKEAQGMPPSVMAEVGRSLLETNPAAARRLLETGARTNAEDALRRSIMSMITGQIAGATAGRVGSPRKTLELTVTP